MLSDSMNQPTTAQYALSVLSHIGKGTTARMRIARHNGAHIWAKHKPKSLVGWMAFLGLCLVLISILSVGLTVVSSILLGMAWLGVVLYTVLVSVSTFAAFIAGAATLFFSGACAILGACMLTCALTAYITQPVLSKARALAQSYMGTRSSQESHKVQMQPVSAHTQKTSDTVPAGQQLHVTPAVSSPSAPAPYLPPQSPPKLTAPPHTYPSEGISSAAAVASCSDRDSATADSNLAAKRTPMAAAPAANGVATSQDSSTGNNSSLETQHQPASTKPLVA